MRRAVKSFSSVGRKVSNLNRGIKGKRKGKGRWEFYTGSRELDDNNEYMPIEIRECGKWEKA